MNECLLEWYETNDIIEYLYVHIKPGLLTT